MLGAQVTGLENLTAKFDSLKQDVRYKGGRFALRKAAQLVRDAARANAQSIDDPNSRENIAKNIVERWSSRYFKATGDLKFRVGVQGGAGGSAAKGSLDGLPGGETRHWRYVEFGTEDTAAQPFMRRALENNTQPATTLFVKEFNKAIERALKKAPK